jgi:hypothetical protein
MSKLSKSVRTYRALLLRIDLRKPMSAEYRECLGYLRSLYGEFGRTAVREALKQ